MTNIVFIVALILNKSKNTLGNIQISDPDMSGSIILWHKLGNKAIIGTSVNYTKIQKKCGGKFYRGYNSYDTYNAAKRACDNSYNCQCVMDWMCDNDGPFTLCATNTLIAENPVGDYHCIYMKPCTDTNNGAKDRNGSDCSNYPPPNINSDYALCGLYDDNDFQARDMCCRCGGGDRTGTGGWGNWGQYGPCTGDCGGVKTRTRRCVEGSGCFGWRSYLENSSWHQTISCNTDRCPQKKTKYFVNKEIYEETLLKDREDKGMRNCCQTVVVGSRGIAINKHNILFLCPYHKFGMTNGKIVYRQEKIGRSFYLCFKKAKLNHFDGISNKAMWKIARDKECTRVLMYSICDQDCPSQCQSWTTADYPFVPWTDDPTMTISCIKNKFDPFLDPNGTYHC